MSSSDSQEGKVSGAFKPLNPISLGMYNGPGPKDVKSFLNSVLMSSEAKSSSASPGSYTTIQLSVCKTVNYMIDEENIW